MVKGVARRVVVVKSPDPKEFEQAIFLLREDALSEDTPEEQILRQAQGGHAGPPNVAEERILVVGLSVSTGEQGASGAGAPGGNDGLDLRVDWNDPVAACIGLDAAGEGLCLGVVGEPGQGAELRYPEAGVAQHKARIAAGDICPVLFQLGKFQVREGSGLGAFHLRQLDQCGVVAVYDVILQGVAVELGE